MIIQVLSRIPAALHLEYGTLGAAAFDTGPEPRVYRYLLSRQIVPDSADDAAAPVQRPGSVVAFVMLNPSTATADKNDPTIAKDMRFAQRWGYEHLLIANAYAWRATDPKELKKAEKNRIDVFGPYNDDVIRAVAQVADLVVCAWGANITIHRSVWVRQLIEEAGKVPHRLRVTHKTMQPEHPLYLPESLVPKPWIFGERRDA